MLYRRLTCTLIVQVNMAQNTVLTSEGFVRGQILKSARNFDYLSFQGIPYAKPPVGDLRFKAPQPPEKWDGVRDALKEGPCAPGFNLITLQWIDDSSEDCLYLNVYTPKTEKPLKPVLFWIHGGGFNGGSGNSDLYGPDYLLAENVVLVTINYRLGAFGFLSLQTAEYPGNNGLRDQIAALKWVQKNIAAFGGDPNNVTIFGESAGGASVHYLILSKLSKGLFHKAIAQSGVTLNPWALAIKPREKAFKFGEILGCKTNDDKELINFLKTVDPKTLVTKSAKVRKFIEPNEPYIRMAFVPTIEPDFEGAVISKHPIEILKSGDFQQVPFLIGANTLEGLIIVTPKNLVNNLDLDRDLPNLLPSELGVEKNSALGQKILNEIKGRYFPSGFSDQNFIDALSCIYFLNGIDRSMEYHAKSSSPTFAYQFSYDGEMSLKTMHNCTFLKGTCHGDELAYLFKVNLIDRPFTPGTPDHSMMEQLTKLWTNFAKNGKPLPDWKPLTESNKFYMDIDGNLTLRENFQKDELDFWKKIYQMASQDKSKL